MTFLQLVNRLITECGVSGGPLVTVASQTGSLGRCVNWVGDAWNELQTLHDDWIWMRSSNILGAGVSFVPLAGLPTCTLGIGAGQVGVATDSFGKWDRTTFRDYPTSVGVSSEIFLDCIDFDVWRNDYMLGAMRTVQTRPTVIAIGPDQSLNVGPPSNGLYTVTGDYYMAPTLMALDADVPLGLPLRFHLLIVYMAMLKYAGYESAMDVYQRAIAETNRLMAPLEAARLPMMSFSGALA